MSYFDSDEFKKAVKDALEMADKNQEELLKKAAMVEEERKKK